MFWYVVYPFFLCGLFFIQKVFNIFVDNLLEGEEGDIKTIYQFGKLKETKLLKRLTSSKFRVNPPCRYYSSCGGCSLMHLDYQAQLEYKRKKVQNKNLILYGLFHQ